MNFKMIGLFVLVALSTACGRIGTGNVGVRTDFNKTVEMAPVPPGWYGAFLTSVDEYVVKETEIRFDNMTPKAGDNLKLEDLDISIFYSVNPATPPTLVTKYAGMSPKEGSLYYPAFNLVERFARGAIYDSVAKFDSLTMHTQRQSLEEKIVDRLQKDLDASDKGAFTITKVIVRQLNTDKSLEASIQQSVQVQKQTEMKKGQIELAKAEAERLRVESEGQARSNQIIANSITPQLVELRRIEAMTKFAQSGTHTVLLPQSGSGTLINVGK